MQWTSWTPWKSRMKFAMGVTLRWFVLHSLSIIPFLCRRWNLNSYMRNPKLAGEIAKQLNSFHQVKVPGSKEPQLWNDILKFYKKASKLTFDDCEKQKKYTQISFKEVEAEILELKVILNPLWCLLITICFLGILCIMIMKRNFTS